MLGRIGFALVQWKSRHSLSDPAASTPEEQKLGALQTGVRGEPYAFWYLRRLGYVFIARNYMPEHAKGELDLIGFDGIRSRSSRFALASPLKASSGFPN
jgi:hypothetical protein